MSWAFGTLTLLAAVAALKDLNTQSTYVFLGATAATVVLRLAGL